jgi:hypothetical protein
MASDAAGQEIEGQSKAKVFISYSRKDIAFADRLEAALKARGFEPLIDRAEIYAFEEWWQRIEALIARADTVAFVLSPDALASDVALREMSFAASLNKRLAPIVCSRVDHKAVPDALAKLNFISFEDAARFEQSADQLAEALNTDIGWVRQHTEFGERARRWALSERASGLLMRSPVLEQAERWIASRPRGAPTPTEETQAFIRQSRQAATRRRTILTSSLTAGLVLALVLAGVAYWQRGIAVEQRGIAQRNEAQAKAERDKAIANFRLAQGTADSLVFDIAHGLRNVQGMSADEIKHDGFRMLVRRDAAGVRLFTRNGHDWTGRFPLIARAALSLNATSCLIDGEAVACDGDGMPCFDRLRYRRQDGHVFLYAFDLIELDGDDLRHEPIERRKAELAKLIRRAKTGLVFNEHIDEPGDVVFRHACKLGLEGIVSKRLGSPYRSESQG